MTFSTNNFFIPLYQNFATSPGWTSATNHRPMGVTWHWTAQPALEDSHKTLRGGSAGGPAKVSAHYCVGATFDQGIDRYVSLDNRSWHAGINQILRWDGKRSTNKTKGARACVGIETAHIGYARDSYPAQPGWGRFVDTDSKKVWTIPPWPEEQFEMMVFTGKEILAAWPHIPWEHHHGHHDICPGYKQDVAGFPFARLLREIYDDDTIPDYWSPLWTTVSRQRVLIALGYDLGDWKDDGAWGQFSQDALTDFQRDNEQVVTPYWTTFTCRAAYLALQDKGMDLEEVATSPTA